MVNMWFRVSFRLNYKWVEAGSRLRFRWTPREMDNPGPARAIYVPSGGGIFVGFRISLFVWDADKDILQALDLNNFCWGKVIT